MTATEMIIPRLIEELTHADTKHPPINDRVQAAALVATFANSAESALRSTADPASLTTAANGLLSVATVALRALDGLDLINRVAARTPPLDAEEGNTDNTPPSTDGVA